MNKKNGTPVNISGFKYLVQILKGGRATLQQTIFCIGELGSQSLYSVQITGCLTPI